MGSQIRAGAALAAILLSGCTLPPLVTPTPSATPAPTPTASPTPTQRPSPTTSPTPDLSAVPDFRAGDLVATRIDGLRVRQRPGPSAVVVTGLLPFDAELQVVMGPILVDDLGWYLLTDADEDEPQFEEGWVAAGFDPEPWLARTGDSPNGSPYVASVATTGDADEGPIEIGEGDHAIRWVASDLDGSGCRFAVSLAQGDGDPVTAIRSTVGDGDLVPGTLEAPAFDALEVRGQAFIAVRSDCNWALVVQRVRSPGPSPAPSGGG